jgi:hypothetical protein
MLCFGVGSKIMRIPDGIPNFYNIGELPENKNFIIRNKLTKAMPGLG